MIAVRPGALFLAAAFAAACDQRVLVGAEPAFAAAGDSNIYWTESFETGNLSEWWSEPGARTLLSTDAHITTTSTAHGGSYAAEASVGNPPVTDPRTARVAEMIREGIMPEAAFYSAWYYLPQSYQIEFYVLMMSLGTRSETLVEGSRDIPLFDVNLNTDPTTHETYFYIWDHLRMKRWESSSNRVLAPVGRWFSIEMYMRKETTDSGRVLVWIDGQPAFDVSGVSTTSNPWMRWAIGPLTELSTTPSPFTVYIDDVTIARMPVTVK